MVKNTFGGNKTKRIKTKKYNEPDIDINDPIYKICKLESVNGNKNITVKFMNGEVGLAILRGNMYKRRGQLKKDIFLIVINNNENNYEVLTLLTENSKYLTNNIIEQFNKKEDVPTNNVKFVEMDIEHKDLPNIELSDKESSDNELVNLNITNQLTITQDWIDDL